MGENGIEYSQLPQIEYATLQEVETARKGVNEFQELLEQSDYRQERFLKVGKSAEMIQSMFLGLKPVSSIEIRELDELAKIKFPERFHIVDNYLYDEILVAKIIKEYPDIFPDVTTETDINSYILQFLKTNPDNINSGSSATYKIGLLHGFPKDAVHAYVENRTYRSNGDKDGKMSRHGFMYGIDTFTPEIQAHSKKVHELFEVSGMLKLVVSKRSVKNIIRRILSSLLITFLLMN